MLMHQSAASAAATASGGATSAAQASGPGPNQHRPVLGAGGGGTLASNPISSIASSLMDGTSVTASTSAPSVTGEPPPPRIMTSSPHLGGHHPGGPGAQVYGGCGPGPGIQRIPSTEGTSIGGVLTNSRAATLSALGSSIGSSGGGMSDSGFAASTSSGFGPGSSTGSTTGVQVGPNKPDLSHLTPEERAIIENVIHRQHNEENREYEFLR